MRLNWSDQLSVVMYIGTEKRLAQPINEENGDIFLILRLKMSKKVIFNGNKLTNATGAE